jgi:hypothetical protein
MVHDALQGAPKVLCSLRAKRREERALGVIARLGAPTEGIAPGIGQFDNVATSVVGVRMTEHQAFAFERVEQGDHLLNLSLR